MQEIVEFDKNIFFDIKYIPMKYFNLTISGEKEKTKKYKKLLE